jgi:hypothetical protein
MRIDFATDVFPIFQPEGLDDVKDPCPVFDGRLWHVFGSGGTVSTETWKIFHATAPALEGPWTQHGLIDPGLDGSGVAAPGVVFEDGVFHMFIQTEFMKSGGRCEHLVSNDGFVWVALPTALHSVPDTGEDGIYDPHPAVVGGEKYIVYSGMSKFAHVPQPDVYLARSRTGTWFGPWERLGKILDHDDVPHHNARGHSDYEWGIEGPQLVELPDGRVMLNATCFLPDGPRGTRQRVFFAVADEVRGPYRTVGPVLEPKEPGENGHSTVLVQGEEITLFYQSRLAGTGHRWRYGIARGRLPAAQAARGVPVRGLA